MSRSTFITTPSPGIWDPPKPQAQATYYTPKEIAQRLKISTQTVRRLFRDRAGVVVITDRSYSGRKRATIRVPESTLLAFEQERSRGFAAEMRESRRG